MSKPSRRAPRRTTGLIRAHRHRNLFQILLIERGGGEMTFEAASLPFAAPAAILVPPTTAHGFRFRAEVTDGWVVSFTEDVAEALGERSGEALTRLKALAADAGRAARPMRPRSSGSRRSAPNCTRKASSRAKAIGWRCAGCSR